MSAGIFITFEGIDGCGKSLMLSMTQKWLEELGHTVLTTREPGGSDLGKYFRQLLLDSEYDSIDANTESLLFMADRSRHVNNVIIPAIKEGKIVLCDRYADSTIAYQGGGRGLNMDLLVNLNAFATCNIQPDLTIYLAISPAIAAERLQGSRDRMEQENRDFFTRVVQTYEDIAQADCERIKKIDASQTPEKVFADIQQEIKKKLFDKGFLING